MTVAWIVLGLAGLACVYTLVFAYPRAWRRWNESDREFAQLLRSAKAGRQALHDLLVLKAIGALNLHGWDPVENAERYE